MLSRSSGDGACAATGEGPAGQAGKCLVGIGVEEFLFAFNGEEIPEEGGVDGRSVCCCTTTVVMAADQPGIYVVALVNKRSLAIDKIMNDSCVVVYADQ